MVVSKVTFDKLFPIILVTFTILQNSIESSWAVALTQESKTFRVCNTSECDLASKTVMNSMDTTVDPCEDFYTFSCGGWIANNPIPDSKSKWNHLMALREKLNGEIKHVLEIEPNSTDPPSVLLAQKLYSVCVSQDNKENHTELRNLVERMTEGPLGTDNKNDVKNLGAILGRIRRELDGKYLLRIFVDFDEKRPMENTIYIDQPNFGVEIPHWLDKNENKFVVAYEQLIKDTWPIVFPEDSRNSTEIARNLVGFERQLAQISTRMEERRNLTTTYNPMSFNDVVDMLPKGVQWTEYFKQVFAETGLTIQWDNVTIVAQDIPYFKALGSILSTTSPSVIRDYLKWRIIFQFGEQVSKKLEEKIFQFKKASLGILAPEPKWKECSKWVNDKMGWAVSYRYIRARNLTSNFKNVLNDIVEDIRNGFREILEESEWIGTETKKIALEKAEAIKSFMAYPDWLLNDTRVLSKEFDGLLPHEFDGNHFSNYVKLTKWSNQKDLKELEKEKDYNKWFLHSSIVNAYYFSSYNAIIFPAGILHLPFYGFPLQSMNYGGIGHVIGHEISHAFDDEGAQTDAKGRLVNWWDEGTFSKYQKKAQCFIDQYGNYSVPELNNTMLNGINTQGENIADNGGLHQAFRGYQAYVKRNGEEMKLPGLDYTPDQLFFIAFAQISCGSHRLEELQDYILTDRHSPTKYRVQGSIANSLDFAHTWKCPVPANTCQIW